MIKLVCVPGELVASLGGFRDLFTKPSFESFRHMTSALAICFKRRTVNNLVETMAKDFEKGKARSSYNWFFSKADWD